MSTQTPDPHLSPETLLDYALGHLPMEEVLAAEAHAANCARCADALAEAGEDMGGEHVCYEEGELRRLLDRPGWDPDLVEAEARRCPRCRALVDAVTRPGGGGGPADPGPSSRERHDPGSRWGRWWRRVTPLALAAGIALAALLPLTLGENGTDAGERWRLKGSGAAAGLTLEVMEVADAHGSRGQARYLLAARADRAGHLSLWSVDDDGARPAHVLSGTISAPGLYVAIADGRGGHSWQRRSRAEGMALFSLDAPRERLVAVLGPAGGADPVARARWAAHVASNGPPGVPRVVEHGRSRYVATVWEDDGD